MPRLRIAATASSAPGIMPEYSDRHSSCSGTKSANIFVTSSSFGARASSIVIGTPWRL